VRWIDGALIAGVCVVGGAAFALWRVHLADERVRDEAERASCAEHAQVSAELERAYGALRDTMRREPIQLGRLSGSVAGDAAEPFSAARHEASAVYVAHFDALSRLVDAQPFAVPERVAQALLGADVTILETLRDVAQFAEVRAPSDPDEAVFAEDHPWALPNLEHVLLRDALDRPPFECMAEVLDVARLRQIRFVREGAGGSNAFAHAGALLAQTFDRCAARASQDDLERALPRYTRSQRIRCPSVTCSRSIGWTKRRTRSFFAVGMDTASLLGSGARNKRRPRTAASVCSRLGARRSCSNALTETRRERSIPGDSA
jgi:hypothetical protein